MGYADMLGLYKGVGKGVGPGLSPDEEQGGMQGMGRALGGGMKGVGAGMMTMVPEVANAMGAQQKATRGAYADMAHIQQEEDSEAGRTFHAKNQLNNLAPMGTQMGQQEQDQGASRSEYARSLLGGLAALKHNILTGSKGGTEMPGGGL